MSYTEGSALAHGRLGADSPSADHSFKDVLWRSANGPDVKPTYPIYSATTRRCIFVGEEAKGMALYSVQQGKAGPAKRLGPEGYDLKITGLAYSPDGRYILHSIRGPGRTQRGVAPGG